MEIKSLSCELKSMAAKENCELSYNEIFCFNTKYTMLGLNNYSAQYQNIRYEKQCCKIGN